MMLANGPFEQGGVGGGGRQRLGHVDGRPGPGRGRATPSADGDDVFEVDRPHGDSHRAGVQAAHVEEVADEDG